MVVNSHPLYQLSYRGSGIVPVGFETVAPEVHRGHAGGVITNPHSPRNFFAAPPNSRGATATNKTFSTMTLGFRLATSRATLFRRPLVND